MVRDGNMSIDFGIASNVEMGSCSFDVGTKNNGKTGQGDGVIF